MYRRFNNQYGFLLADGVIAIMIITVALVACVGVLISAHKATKVSAGQTAAVYLAQKQAELLKSNTAAYWGNMSKSLPVAIDWQGEDEDLENLNGIDYAVTTTARTCKESSSLVEVTIDVGWNENGRDYNYQLITAYPTVAVTKS